MRENTPRGELAHLLGNLAHLLIEYPRVPNLTRNIVAQVSKAK